MEYASKIPLVDIVPTKNPLGYIPNEQCHGGPTCINSYMFI